MRHPFSLRFAAPALALALALTGCMTGRPELNLQPTSRNPGAVGTVGLSEDRNGNTVAEVKMEHLPLPSTLSPELSTYVVWARPAGGQDYVNMGQVAIDPGDREGRTFVRLPYSAFELLVTAETVPTAQAPSAYRILQGSVGGVPARSAPPAAAEPPRTAPPPSETMPPPAETTPP